MQLFNRNKKVRKEGSFSESNYSVLDYEQLLLVNGAGGSSRGPSGPTGPSSTPSQTSSGSKFVENSNQGVANANVGDKIQRNDGTIVTLTQADIDWAKSKVNSGNTTTSTNTSTNSNTSNQSPSATYAKNDATNKIENAIAKIGKKNYTKGNYRCDNYVEDVIKQAGYNPKDYYVDNPIGKNVNQHISELTTTGKNKYTTDASKLTQGTYVVFMSDKEGVKQSHASLLVVDSNGTAYMQDNSSHNNATKWDGNGKPVAWAGGTETTNGKNAYDVCSKYTGYENFYFQKLK